MRRFLIVCQKIPNIASQQSRCQIVVFYSFEAAMGQTDLQHGRRLASGLLRYRFGRC
jgi:hypothetical protein